LKPGLINVDFADVRTIMQNTGKAVMGTGVGKGEGGAVEAAKKAILNPLLEDSTIEGARGILLNITGGINLSLSDVQEAASVVYDCAHDSATIIIGNVIDPDIDDEMRITVIATGFEEKKEKVDIPQIRKWAPVHEPVTFKASGRVLSKNLSSATMMNAVPSDLMQYEDPLDVPTFIRKAPQRDM
ncbi:MAG: cell division protein FtsZ, partial [Nitrospirae bacterium]|nr:cell division protein FtsZ [Nitrospirota bacterium]